MASLLTAPAVRLPRPPDRTTGRIHRDTHRLWGFVPNAEETLEL